MKLIFLIDSLQQGGMEKQLIYLANFLNETKRFDIEILLFNKDKKNIFYTDILDAGIKVSDFSVSKNITIPFFSFQIEAFKIARKLKKLNSKIFISFGTNSSFILVIAKLFFLKKNVKIIVSERNTDLAPLSFKRKYYLYFHRFSNTIVPNSFTQEAMITGLYPMYSEKIKVINNYVDLEFYSPKSYNFNKEQLNVVLLGRLTYQKNPMCLMKALKLIKEKTNHKISVSWFGRTQDQELFNEVSSYIKAHNLDVKFHKPQVDTLSIYHKYDLLCLPSFFEGFSNVLGESICCGLPVIVSEQAGDVRKMVDHQANGFLFDCYNEEALYDQFVRFIELPESEKIVMGKESRKKSEEIFSKEEYLNAYTNLILDE